MVTWSSISTLLGLPREPLQQPLDLAVLLALAVGPFPDHLLLGAHMRDQSLNGLREIGHCGRGVAAAPTLTRGAQFVGREGEVPGRRSAIVAIVAHGGGEPVFEIGVEAVLRL